MNLQRRSQLRSQLRGKASHWRELVATHGTPLLVLDPYRVAAQYSLLTEHLRGFRLHYAVKALPHPAVLTVLAASGSSFDVATGAEVDLVRRLGISMARCIYTHPVKKPADIDHAYANGIRTFVVDNPIEAQKFVGRDPDIEILVRLAFPNPSAKSDLSTKFGAAPADAELLVKHVVTAGVRFAGFSFHVGSQGTSVTSYRDALRSTLDLTKHVERTLGLPVSTVDIGGGFPVSYRDPMPPIDAIGDLVDKALGPNHDYAMLAEPGRFVVADCMTLLTSVVGSATREGRTWHYLDDGLYGSYSNVMTEDVHPPILALSELDNGDDPGPPLEPVTLAGPTCDSVDVVASDYPMPSLTVGDVVVSPTMGAYTSVTASRFNGIAETPIVVSTGRR